MLKNNLVRLIRRLQTTVSITLFIIVFLFSYKVTGFRITDIQLSRWGGSDLSMGWLWNLVVAMLAVSIFFNVILFIKKHHRLKNKIIPYILFSFVSICLLVVSFFNLEHTIIHTSAAYLYFFSYPLSIFIMAYINRQHLLYREWFTHLIFSIIMAVLPLFFISLFEGLAISETAHIVVVCVWNIYVAFKVFEDGKKTV